MKKVLSTILALALVASTFAACTAKPASTPTPGSTAAPANVTLKVWGPQEEQANLKTMTDSFKAANPETNYTFEFGVVAEGDGITKYSEDPSAAADVFMFENGQTNDFVKNGGLYEVTINKDDIVARNMPVSIDAASADGKLYAYPMTADNGYFMYYDKSVFSADDVKSLDKMLEVAGTANKKFFMDVSNGYFIASFFLGGGCTMSLDADGNQILDFNNEKGVTTGEAIRKFTANPAFLTGDDTVLTGGFGTSIAAGVSGIWNAEAIKGKLGDNFAACALPTFTWGTEQKQMASFGGYKLVGVNSLTAYPEQAMALADWLTNEENQAIRFKTRQMGPSNIKVADSAEVKANESLVALAAQNEFALPQNNVSNSYWGASDAFGLALENKDKTDMKTLLDQMVSQIQAAAK